MKTQEAPLVNKVAQSGLITLELEDFHPGEEWVEIDMADFLFKGLILKEKEFRQKVSEEDWDSYADKNVNVLCSTDAIVPPWAYMLISKKLLEAGAVHAFGSKEEAIDKTMARNLEQNLNPGEFEDKRILVKGCSTKKIPQGIYMLVTEKLRPVVKSLMYGEACSNVPVYKKPVSRKRR